MGLLVPDDPLGCLEVAPLDVRLEALRVVGVVDLLPRYDRPPVLVSRQDHVLGLGVRLQLGHSDRGVRLLVVARHLLLVQVRLASVLDLLRVGSIDLLVVVNDLLDPAWGVSV